MYKDPKTGKLYAPDDPRFIGQGNPPSFPNSPGAGRDLLEPEEVADSKKTEPKGKDPYRPDPQEQEQAALAALQL